jgi:RimJ/RimL family protein N-acetyltransferase
VAEVALRPIDDSDLDALFEQMRDPESVRMAAFTAENPDDRTAFDAHMAKVRTLPGATTRAVTVDGRLAGSIASFVVDGDTEVTYWIDRSFWGQGIAGRALALLLESVRVRPVIARAASDNVRSLKVLQRAGFAIMGTAIPFANARDKEIEETILRLDEPAKSAPPMRRAGTGRLTDLGRSGRHLARLVAASWLCVPSSLGDIGSAYLFTGTTCRSRLLEAACR